LNSIGGLSENADDSGFFIAFLHSIKVWRVRNARHKSHPRVTVASESTFSPEFHTPGAGDDKGQAVKSLCGAVM
jgi:hypothetical protein